MLMPKETNSGVRRPDNRKSDLGICLRFAAPAEATWGLICSEASMLSGHVVRKNDWRTFFEHQEWWGGSLREGGSNPSPLLGFRGLVDLFAGLARGLHALRLSASTD